MEVDDEKLDVTRAEDQPRSMRQNHLVEASMNAETHGVHAAKMADDADTKAGLEANVAAGAAAAAADERKSAAEKVVVVPAEGIAYEALDLGSVSWVARRPSKLTATSCAAVSAAAAAASEYVESPILKLNSAHRENFF